MKNLVFERVCLDYNINKHANPVEEIIVWCISTINTLSVDMWGFGIKQIGSVGTGTSFGQILKSKTLLKIAKFQKLIFFNCLTS